MAINSKRTFAKHMFDEGLASIYTKKLQNNSKKETTQLRKQKDVNRQFIQEDKHMMEKSVKRCLTLHIIESLS